MTEQPNTGGRIVHAQLHLLDRQIVEHRTGRMVAKVDDVELDLEADVPVVTGLLCGPAAWGPRLPGVLGRAPAPLAHDQLVPVRHLAHHDRLQQPELADGVRQLG